MTAILSLSFKTKDKSLTNIRLSLIVFIVNQYGEERCETRKMNKKKFLSSFKDSNFKVKLVETYPTEMINDIFYINKNGKTVWIREEIE